MGSDGAPGQSAAARLLLSPCCRVLRLGCRGLGGCIPGPRKSRLMSTLWSDQVEGRDALAPALCEPAPCCMGWRGTAGCGWRGPPMLGRGWHRQRQDTWFEKEPTSMKNITETQRKYRESAASFSELNPQTFSRHLRPPVLLSPIKLIS